MFLDKATIAPQEVDFTRLDSALPDWQYFDGTTSEDILSRIRDADLVISNKVPLSAETLEHCKKLKCICIAATGFDHVDLKAAARLGIFVCNVVNYSTPSVVQHTFGLMIALMSQIIAYGQEVAQDAWAHSNKFCLNTFQTHDLHRKTLGIVGYGRIGKAVARVAEAFGMNVVIADHKERDCSQLRQGRTLFSDVLRQADILTLHCPLLSTTKDLIADKELEQMQPSALLINVARGGLVNEAALYRALTEGKIAGAGLDVLTQEPPSPNHPLLSLHPSKFVLTPHVAWNSVESRQKLVDELALNVLAFKQQRPRNALL